MKKDRTLVLPKHIDLGIEKYEGKICSTIAKHLENKGWNYVPYRFNDDRILLVYPNNTYAILYANEEVLFGEMDDTE